MKVDMHLRGTFFAIGDGANSAFRVNDKCEQDYYRQHNFQSDNDMLVEKTHRRPFVYLAHTRIDSWLVGCWSNGHWY